jgi:CO dehydrogenase maturation factor
MSRGVARGVDLLMCITEPTVKSIDVTKETHRLSRDLGVRNFVVVGNKVISDDDRLFIEKSLSEVEVIGYLPYDENLIKADRLGISILDYNPSFALNNGVK